MVRKKSETSSCSLRTICRRAKVPRKQATAIFTEIIEAAIHGEEVSIPRIGRFWAVEVPSRKVVIPKGPGATETHQVTTRATMRLYFRSTWMLKTYMRMRVKGRAKGIR